MRLSYDWMFLSMKRNLELTNLLETDISDFFEDMDLEEICETRYEEDRDVDIIDGFFHQSVAYAVFGIDRDLSEITHKQR